MGEHDLLGKTLLRLAAGDLFTDAAPEVCFDFAPGAGSARIDGVVAGVVAVEVESRVPKQVRGALLDLILHPYPKKLLLLVPAHTGNPTIAVRQAETILARFVEAASFRVVCVTESADRSVGAIRTALAELGVEIVATE